MTEETARAAYLRLREDWQALLGEKDAPMRSPHKDRLFDSLARAWNRLTVLERKDVGAYCVAAYH